MENEYGFNIPKNMHKYFGRVVKQASDIYHIKNCAENNMLELEAVINFEGEDYVIKGKVNGPIDAFNNALKQNELKNYKFKNYHEHALSNGSHAKGVVYVEIEDNVEVAYDVEKYDENEIRRIGKKLLKLLELEIKN